MKVASWSTCLAFLLSSCLSAPYYGKPVKTSPSGKKTCGVHGTELTPHEGFIFNGFIRGTEEFEFAASRYPNVIGPNFSPTYNEEFSQTLSFAAYTCDDCITAHERLKNVPEPVKKIAQNSSQKKRDRQIEAAAKKAKRTGNPSNAKISEGNGSVSRVY
ncbi:hypothetical protein VSU19_17485 [Verrucomicrobiales bacterium BCK34]|nr:hypothetical protein [Verrucomicrobiales bacterium BCK34]